MGMAPTALRVTMLLSFLAASTEVLALELGALQAISSGSPPYIFRLPIGGTTYDPAPIAAVTVRQPSDAVAFVRQNMLEVRLRTLSDVELEVSRGGQTLNRLLLKSEFQTARLRPEAAPASSSPQPGSATGRGQRLAEAMPLTPVSAASADVPDRAVRARELEGIRQEVRDLVGRVMPWGKFAPPGAETGESTVPVGLTLLLGGLCLAAMTTLVTGYVIQRRALDRERRRRRALTLALRRMQDQLARAGHGRLAVQVAPPPVTRLRRVQVSQKTRRRLRMRARRHMSEAAHVQVTEPMRLVERPSSPGHAAPPALLEALAQLRRELLRLQRRPLAATTAPDPEVEAGRPRR